MIAPRMSQVSMNNVTEKIQRLHIHRWRKPIEEIATQLKPILRGVINYYCRFYQWKTTKLWWSLNVRLIKWVEWEKRLNKLDAVRWLKVKYKEKPYLFPHWALVRP